MTADLVISKVDVQFSGGLISVITLTYSMVGPSGENWNGQAVWNLTPSDQNSPQATGFVSAMIGHMTSIFSNLTVTTT